MMKNWLVDQLSSFMTSGAVNSFVFAFDRMKDAGKLEEISPRRKLLNF